MIDRVVADIPDAVHGFTLIFSGTPFPGHQYRLDCRRGERGGTGTTRKRWTWKVGCALRFSDISKSRRGSFTFRPRVERDFLQTWATPRRRPPSLIQRNAA